MSTMMDLIVIIVKFGNGIKIFVNETRSLTRNCDQVIFHPMGWALVLPSKLHHFHLLNKVNMFCKTLYQGHYGLVLAPRLKKGYHQIWEANLQPLGPMF
jgi:hypothetical protein